MSNQLTITKSGSLSVTGGSPAIPSTEALTVGKLERELLRRFPAEDACKWDQTGLLAGDPAAPIAGVAVALDPTICAMRAALAAGCNVLLTHHPVYLEAPTGFLPVAAAGETPGSRIAFALTQGLNLINFHTALDVSVEGLEVLPQRLRLVCDGPLEPLAPTSPKGFVMACHPAEGERLTLGELAARCVAVNQAHPRVWGNNAAELNRIAVCGGSAGDFLETCREQDIDCLVCGEVKYHAALDVSCNGLALIELGHDVSELPLCRILADATIKAGVDPNCITMVNQEANWHTPEATRR